MHRRPVHRYIKYWKYLPSHLFSLPRPSLSLQPPTEHYYTVHVLDPDLGMRMTQRFLFLYPSLLKYVLFSRTVPKSTRIQVIYFTTSEISLPIMEKSSDMRLAKLKSTSYKE